MKGVVAENIFLLIGCGARNDSPSVARRVKIGGNRFHFSSRRTDGSKTDCEEIGREKSHQKIRQTRAGFGTLIGTNRGNTTASTLATTRPTVRQAHHRRCSPRLCSGQARQESREKTRKNSSWNSVLQLRSHRTIEVNPRMKQVDRELQPIRGSALLSVGQFLISQPEERPTR